jgi:hypothetical protein
VAPSGAKSNSDEKGMGEVVADLWQLVRDYAKQETIDPLKSIGRFVAFGVGGALSLGLGLLLLTLALLRALQNETGAHLTGSWNFVPYLVTLVVAALAAALAVRAITKPERDHEARS